MRRTRWLARWILRRVAPGDFALLALAERGDQAIVERAYLGELETVARLGHRDLFPDRARVQIGKREAVDEVMAAIVLDGWKK